MFHALSPAQYKSLAVYPAIRYGLAPSPYGEMAIAWWSDADAPYTRAPYAGAICYLALQGDLQKMTDALHHLFPRNALVADTEQATRLTHRIVQGATLPVLLTGTPFFLQIWQHLYNTPRGHTLSYGELAALAGRPKASRAVGQAMATNPIALLVPCHRVLRSGKTGTTPQLGGYAYGLPLKQRLLAEEQTIARRAA